jgi:hypothetical protein
VQVVANRSIRKQIYINAEDVIYQFRLLGWGELKIFY